MKFKKWNERLYKLTLQHKQNKPNVYYTVFFLFK